MGEGAAQENSMRSSTIGQEGSVGSDTDSVLQVCRSCDGSGVVVVAKETLFYDEETEDCSTCRGSGDVEKPLPKASD